MESLPPAPSVKLRLNSWLWPILAVILLVLQIFLPSRAWSTLLIILGCTWVLAFFWTHALGRGLSLDRKMRYGWAQVGDQLEEYFTIINKSRLPGLWLEVDDHSDIPDYSAGRVNSIGAREIMEWRTKGICTRRGLFTLGPTSLRSGDPLGLCTVEIKAPHSVVLLVLPPILPLPMIGIATGGRAGDARRPRRAALEATVSVDTVRDYIPGEPLKTIHWPTTARRGSLYVRQFEHTPSSDWWIFLDMESRHQVGIGFDSTEEHGVILAASLAARGLKEGHMVGMVACGQELTWIPPRRNSSQLGEILRALAVIHPGERPLADLLREAQISMQRGASVILITPNLQGEWAANLLQLMRSDITPTVLLFDPVTFNGTDSPTETVKMLNKYGIVSHVISRQLLDRPKARPRQPGKWEWRVLGPGTAVVERRPADTGWREVG